MKSRVSPVWYGWLLGGVAFCVMGGLSSRGQEPVMQAPQTPTMAQGGAPDTAGPAGDRGGVAARSARLTLLAEGVVLVGRKGGSDTAPAQQNMALAEGSLVSAMENGQAEIEFEDGSVARLTPNSSLSLESMGAKTDGAGYVTILRVVRGLAYLELRSSGLSRYRVLAGADTFWPVENSTVRVSLEDPPPVISVLDGRIRVEHVATPGSLAAGEAMEGYRTEVRAGESLRSDVEDASRYFLTESVPPGTWDQWNETRDQQAANEVASGTPVRQGYEGQQGYGWSDLDASGSWYGATGRTPVWQPDEALEAGFDPYGYGSWTSFGFGGAGYVWASSYSWGWTPFRCGQWQFWDGFGWGWQPNSLCGRSWSFGGYGVNVGRGPRGYVPIQVPIRRTGGVHPIVPGPHPGERPGFARERRQVVEVGERRIAGVAMQPIRAAEFGYTARGGSAVGSALRRDFPVERGTRQAVMGTVGTAGFARPIAPVSAGTTWRSVETRPATSTGFSGGGFGVSGRGPHRTEGSPARVESEVGRRAPDASGRAWPSGGVGMQRPQTVQPGVGVTSYRGSGSAPAPGQRFNPPPAPAMRPAPPPMMHSAPAPMAAPAMRSTAPPPSGGGRR